MSYDTLIVQQQNITGQQSLNLNVARAVSCLKAVYLTFFKQDNKALPNADGSVADTRKAAVISKTPVNKETVEFTCLIRHNT